MMLTKFIRTLEMPILHKIGLFYVFREEGREEISLGSAHLD